MSEVGVIDYGSGNIFSIVKAFEYLDYKVALISSPDQIKYAHKLILPGVGAFGSVIHKLEDSGFRDAIIAATEAQIPFLGICVGMQVLFDCSSEFGDHRGLGLLKGTIEQIPKLDVDGNPNRIPHVGWAELSHSSDNVSTDGVGALFASINGDDSFYFVHSFAASPHGNEVSVAKTIYGGRPVTAAVRQGMVFGTQFHPEKSGMAGLKVLKNFACL